MPYETCQRPDCAQPSEVVVVLVMVSLVVAEELGPIQVALCGDHADQLALLTLDSGEP